MERIPYPMDASWSPGRGMAIKFVYRIAYTVYREYKFRRVSTEKMHSLEGIACYQ
jgi:hypothetical protein